jgi:hypothetical protein
MFGMPNIDGGGQNDPARGKFASDRQPNLGHRSHSRSPNTADS